MVRLSAPAGEIRFGDAGALLRRVVRCRRPAAVARALAVLDAVELERIALVAQVAGEPEPAVATAFDELVRAAVVVCDGQRRYRFAHRIVAEALYEEIGPAQRRRLHARAARLMLAARERGEPVDLLDLARHLAASVDARRRGRGGGARRGRPARVAHARRTPPPVSASGPWPLLGPGAPERAELLALQCRALARAARPEPAVAPGREALALLPAGRGALPDRHHRRHQPVSAGPHRRGDRGGGRGDRRGPAAGGHAGAARRDARLRRPARGGGPAGRARRSVPARVAGRGGGGLRAAGDPRLDAGPARRHDRAGRPGAARQRRLAARCGCRRWPCAPPPRRSPAS